MIEQKLFFIPRNVGGYINVLGFPIRTRNLIEAVLFSALSATFMFRLVMQFLSKYLIWQVNVTLILLVAVPVFILGLLGIDGLPLTTWLKIFFKFHTSQNITQYYNQIFDGDVKFDLLATNNDDEGFNGSFYSEMIGKTKKKMSDRTRIEFEKSIQSLQRDDEFKLIYDPTAVSSNDPYGTEKSFVTKIKERIQKSKQEKLYAKRRQIALKQLKAEVKKSRRK